jgi:L,D-transpeptidase ErfK/SrfK
MLPEEIAQLFPQVEVGTPVKIVYRPIKLAVTPEGRIYLEVHPDIYQKKLNPMEYLKELADHYQLGDRLDWDKAPAILKAKEGIAQDVTKEGAGTTTVKLPAAGERLSPLQGKEAKLE